LWKNSDYSAETNFKWLRNYTIEPERSYRTIKKDTNTTFVFKTTGAVFSIILLNELRKPTQMEITSALFVPCKEQKLTKIMNLETGTCFEKRIN